MRIALLSDIHGNHMALEAVLEKIRETGVDAVIVLGDVATIGPAPTETLEQLQQLDARFVMGNHDRTLLEPHNREKMRIAPVLYPDIDWCLNQLTDSHINFISGFERTINLALPGGHSLCAYHGSPDSEVQNIYPTTDSVELVEIFKGEAADILCGGHTHIQMVRNFNGKWLINPGSVGQPFHHTPFNGEPPQLLPHAEWAVLNCTHEPVEITLQRTAYDTRAYLNFLQNSSLPIKQWLITQYT